MKQTVTGFRERSSAFDLKAVLDDFVRFLDRQKRAEETSAVEVSVRIIARSWFCLLSGMLFLYCYGDTGHVFISQV